ncbi:MAG: AGE family epimerase/isomerase [Paracoccus sp. (in: a-proteobacteria)]|uniref:AGE family epimerase/isomerase n=1 Tax=Paracoccus sp. TaxID=267 RepID=UPI0026DEEA3B|nr:AGE family epimerase/isomerase [Paracoccus sp. (in: a-proteobacteria)]MDO5613079.1 AGE family epimerase/isomerase [Paracoccus sp. (in: a-proteobacteria)]
MSLVPDMEARSAGDWAGWFWATSFPDWLKRVTDPEGGLFEALDADGAPVPAGQTVLAQARGLFALSYLALLSGDPALKAAAGRQVVVLDRFRKAPGLYRRMVARDGRPPDDVARSYDQTFVILGLSTWNRLAPSLTVQAEIDACWTALKTTLTDPATGLLLEDDSVTDPAAPTAPPRAQNPHMHLYEACLHACEMSGDLRWHGRAAELRARALKHFFDRDTGSIAEFLTPDLRPLSGPDGRRREPGHQCEWAWLLRREVELGGDPALLAIAGQLEAFADAHGFATTGPLTGAAYDAVSAQGVMESSHLLWPQTEAIKAFAMRHTAGEPGAADRAKSLLTRMFDHWFAGRSAFVNRLDAQGHTLWPEALTRLQYHLVLALTEGARAGLWPGIPRH